MAARSARAGIHTTTGIVSGLDRSLTRPPVHPELIQTDAAINPGNSGGLLLDRVVGVNTAILSESRWRPRGFAIPSNTVRCIVPYRS